MTKKERYQLAKIVYQFVELSTRLNAPNDGDLVANEAAERFREIRTMFNLKDELVVLIENDYSLDDEDKHFLRDFISR